MRERLKVHFIPPVKGLIGVHIIYFIYLLFHYDSPQQEGHWGYPTTETVFITRVVTFIIFLLIGLMVQILLIPLFYKLGKIKSYVASIGLATAITTVFHYYLTPDVYPEYYINWMIYFLTYFMLNCYSSFRIIEKNKKLCLTTE